MTFATDANIFNFDRMLQNIYLSNVDSTTIMYCGYTVLLLHKNSTKDDNKKSLMLDRIEFLLVCIAPMYVSFQASLSLPGSPFVFRRGSRASQMSWKHRPYTPRGAGDTQPLVPNNYFDALNFPYADDSRAVTPSLEDLCNAYNTPVTINTRRRLSSATSCKSNASYHGNHYEGPRLARSRRSSYNSEQSKYSDTSKTEILMKRGVMLGKGVDPTHFFWHKPHAYTAVPDVIVNATRSEDNVSLKSHH
jgi:hypothetical protein